MEQFLGIAGINAAGALLLALGVAATARIVKRPALAHALWIVVLLELFAPPVLEVGVLPGVDPMLEQPATSRAAVLPSAVPSTAAFAPTEARGITLPGAAVSVWAAGSLLLLLLAAVRIRRFRRLLREGIEAPPDLGRMARELSERLGMASCPRIRLVPADISPMLWFRFGSPQILFPARLLDRLTDRELRTLLAHELGHVRRRDHWVRYFELIAGTLFWWHPVVWWARAGLRRAEEQCCDGLVMKALPGHSRDYARGLLKTVEFLSGSGHGLPALASGAGEVKNLEARLTMIMKRRLPKSLSRWQWTALALAAVALLLVFPTRAAQDREAEWVETAPTEIIELEKQALELELQLRQVRSRQMELEAELQQEHERFELQRLREEAARNEAEGRLEQAQELRRRERELLEQAELQDRQLDLERERVDRLGGLEAELRRTALEAEELALKGEHDRARELEARAMAVRAELLQREAMAMRKERDLEQVMIRRQLDAMRQELARARAEGRGEEAENLAREMALFEDEVARSEQARRAHDEARAMHEIAEELARSARRLEEQGRHEESAEIELRIQELLESIRDRELEAESGVR